MKKKISHKLLLSFTLAEVLITLGIIGIVAEMILPSLIKNTQDQIYKTAYKKAFSDISQVFAIPIQERNLTLRPSSDPVYSAAAGFSYDDWNILRSKMKINKDCTNGVQFYAPTSIFYNCWADGEKIDTSGPSSDWYSPSFIDASGRSWAAYSWNVSMFLVDTNGLKGPNKFGKDRWQFVFQDATGNNFPIGLPAKIGPYKKTDVTSADPSSCNYSPCYFKSWLYE